MGITWVSNRRRLRKRDLNGLMFSLHNNDSFLHLSSSNHLTLLFICLLLRRFVLNQSTFRFTIWKGKGNLADDITIKYIVWRHAISLRLCGAQSGQGKLLVAHSNRNIYSVVPHLGAHIRIPPRLQKVRAVQAEKFSFLPQESNTSNLNFTE